MDNVLSSVFPASLGGIPPEQRAKVAAGEPASLAVPATRQQSPSASPTLSVPSILFRVAGRKRARDSGQPAVLVIRPDGKTERRSLSLGGKHQPPPALKAIRRGCRSPSANRTTVQGRTGRTRPVGAPGKRRAGNSCWPLTLMRGIG